MDRSIHRFLCLPLFDDVFRSVLAELNLDRIELWLSLADDGDGDTADHKLCLILSALTQKQEVMDQILSRLDMVNVLASMVSRSTEKIRREIAVDLGYGYAEPASIGAKRKPVASPLPKPAPLVVGARPSGQGPTEEVPSIQVVETSERKKWGLRLQKICERAGAASGLNDAKRCAGLLPAEAARLKSLAFEAGGFRTIRQNVRYWEKFEEWSIGHGLRVYPPTIVAVMRYALCAIGVWSFHFACVQVRTGVDMQEARHADPEHGRSTAQGHHR